MKANILLEYARKKEAEIKFTENGKTYERVNKTKAKNLYSKGRTIFLLPCKVRFENEWIMPSAINAKEDKGQVETFDDIVNEFEYYNCRYAELGKYASYYVRVR